MKKLRSQHWFEGVNPNVFTNRSWLAAQGFSREVFDGRPVIGICNSWSELNNCNAHLRQVAEAVKRGVWEAGGLPLEFPVISLGEVFMRPTTMLYRNLMAMDVEESIRANPIDGVVLLTGCDKTTPAQIMGAASADLPTIVVPGGPMLKGYYKNNPIGSGTDVWKFEDMRRLGTMTDEEFVEIESCISRSFGHCMVMGTASTMTSIAEALGTTLPGAANIPAVDTRRYAQAQESGKCIVKMVFDDLRLSKIITRKSIENAITVNMAIGGSTNAVIHLIAICGRLGIDICLEDFDRISKMTPLIVNVKPSGKYMMEDMFYAGGIPAVIKQIEHLLHTDALTVTGKTLKEAYKNAEVYNEEIIRSVSRPLHTEGGTVILKGNLAPNGAVIKQTAASPHLLQHRGKAVVFENRDDMLKRIHSADLDVSPESILVMKNCGPIGGPGMPEWGHIPIPQKLLEQGIADMVRISDARMSGTSFGTIVLHVSPESAIGGTLAIVQDGDYITLDVAGRILHLEISEQDIQKRLQQWKPPKPWYERGYGKLFLDHVQQAEKGCDFDILISGPADTLASKDLAVETVSK
ncbi:MAG TPA: IlvD/Edd family dehydratase [Chitinophagaceae bacterium]|nr:IlvD/Edd family dehydratase [Chitinophagaceae bacterium]